MVITGMGLVASRDVHLSGQLGGVDLHRPDSPQIHGLKIASIAVAATSVLSAILSLLWFVRMKRSFRHDLIMLLIQSDMTKALWLTIFPIYELIHGPVKSTSAFCQTSGFFLTLGIEASDVAVLLIALHTGLYIFRGGSGLYPYRRYAYAGFAVTPLLLTLLAFINKPAFVNSGEFCYLPTEPGWSRRALSWAPRYVIFASILLAYGYIYIYVTGLMNKFGAVGKAQRLPASRRQRLRRRGGSVPPTPPIAYHGLIPSTSSSEASAANPRDRQDSVSTLESAYVPVRRVLHTALWEDGHDDAPEHCVRWKMPDFGHPRACASHLEPADVSMDPLSTHTAPVDLDLVKVPSSTFCKDTEPLHRASISATATSRPSGLERNFWHRSLAPTPTRQSRSISLPNILAILRHGPRSSVSSTSTFLPPPLLESMGMTEARAKIRRQLRQLFIYPLVYLAVWLVPFVSHIKGEDDHGTPTVLVMVSLLSLCIQGTANALVFSIKEKPWRHSKRRLHGFHASFWSRCRAQEGANPNVGRTREEMLVDGRIARRRRDGELAERRLRQFSRQNSTTDWWERLQDSVDNLEDLNQLIERAT